ncbi:hypothetical protein KMZ32_01155 [Phycicoccus sp. MAQZ13P-2]|uniref:hypothetical protein n=1 Tax=Phycicoccus mangrovi TaxID=2840470 RepID=UPI001C002320|nr:hypothetical protein [Phycicoccus mangrovi]MBT9254300.1 hypothetical protein [Phycicoccus mangrovi]MBT9272678.1 hypothetical protein [Phycicoccus mangrovi]
MILDRLVPALAAVCAGSLLVGCASDSGQVLDADGVTVLVAERTDSGDDALLSGRLTDVGGCLGVDETVVVWPAGTSVTTDGPATVHVPGRPSAALGDPMEVGGGVALEPGEERTDHRVAGVVVPAACAAQGVWVASPAS